MINIVVDTNVFVSALMSKRGASYLLLQLIGTGAFNIALSIPLVLEYEEVAKRYMGTKILLPQATIDNIIDFVCASGLAHEVYFLWRPSTIDPHDNMVLELAVKANCRFIITYNISDFQNIDQFGIAVITPKTFLEYLGVIS